jgi:hypothetical protein
MPIQSMTTHPSEGVKRVLESDGLRNSSGRKSPFPQDAVFAFARRECSFEEL